MLTRRKFLRWTTGTLAALGVGIKPGAKALRSTQGGVAPSGESVISCSSVRAMSSFGIQGDTFDYREGDIVNVTLDGKAYRKVVSMPKLDSAGVDTKKLRSLFDDGDCDAIIAARLIQMLDSNDFDSLAQYSRCVTSIAEEFGL